MADNKIPWLWVGVAALVILLVKRPVQLQSVADVTSIVQSPSVIVGGLIILGVVLLLSVGFPLEKKR